MVIYNSMIAGQSMVVWMIEMVLLVVMSYQDITTMEIPFHMHIIGAVNGIAGTIITGHARCLLFNLIEAIILFVIFMTAGLFFGMGGADILAAAVMALGNRYAVIACMIACALAIPYNITRSVKRKDTSYPFIPFLAIGYVMIYFYL